MAVYAVEARPRVRKALRQLDVGTRENVLEAMRSLGANPRPQGVKPLKATGHGCEYGWVTIGATFALLALYLLIQST